MSDQQDDANTQPESSGPEAPPPVSGFQMQPPAPLPGQPPVAYEQPPGYPERKPKWPIVIGVLSIVLGSICACQGLVGFAMQSMMPELRKMMEQYPEPFRTYGTILAVLGLVKDLLLTVGGIVLISRKRIAVPLHMVYAIATICLTIANLVITYNVFDEMAPPGARPPAAFKDIMVFSMGLGFLIAIAYPLFLLIWFSRGKIREQVRQWTASRTEQNIYEYPQ